MTSPPRHAAPNAGGGEDGMETERLRQILDQHRYDDSRNWAGADWPQCSCGWEGPGCYDGGDFGEWIDHFMSELGRAE